MDLFESSRLLHIAVGTLVLASFWAAIASRKGGARHRLFGKVYLVAMSILLSATLVMAAGMVVDGTPMRAVFDVYVTLISVVSCWTAWRSIRDRDDVDRYRGAMYKVLCGTLGCYGLFLLTVVPKMGDPARMAMVTAFAVLGLSIAGAMLFRIVRGADHSRWWLSEHLTAMALNFAATHASFSILGMSVIFPVVKQPWVRTGILVSWMIAALIVRVWAGRRFLGSAPPSPRRYDDRLESAHANAGRA